MADDDEFKEEVADSAPFNPTKKKKVVIQEPVDDSMDTLAEKTESLSVTDGLDSTFVGLKKKKKKPVENSTLNDEGGDVGKDLEEHTKYDDGAVDGIALQTKYPWEGSDHDYEYEELLGRVFNILRENNLELAGDRHRKVMRPLQVFHEGTKKIAFVNLMDFCKTYALLSSSTMVGEFVAICGHTWGSLMMRRMSNFPPCLRRKMRKVERLLIVKTKKNDTFLSRRPNGQPNQHVKSKFVTPYPF
ncbi:hypothetical protein UlMin_028002 [Ulmus minor]